MNYINRTLIIVHRRWYLLATYSGIRSIANRAYSFFWARDLEIARAIDGAKISPDDLGDIGITVHSRACPPSGDDEATYGMISIRQQRPRVSRLLYRYFCLTSHFGSGHMEIAFYEQGHRITFYAVRNIARSNARRLGLTKIANKLLLTKHDEEIKLILEVATLLGNHGFVTQFARPDECVSLSVCSRLLRPAVQARALVALKCEYERLHRRLRQRMHDRVGGGFPPPSPTSPATRI